MRLLLVIVVAIVFSGCSDKKDNTLKTGMWHGVIEIQGHELPFNFELIKDSLSNLKAYIINAKERILLDEISIQQDSITIVMHIFDSQLKAIINGDSLNGLFIKNYEQDYKLPFKAAFEQTFRFPKVNSNSNANFTGKYAVTFLNDRDTTQAIGIFKQQNDHITGTFLTPTGDYRYLEGNVIEDSLHLSTFDGNHLYLFTATKKNDSTLHGKYWSGKSWYQTWVGIKDDNATLPDDESITYLKPGFDKIDFSFRDLEGKLVTPADEKYKNKVLILQLFGTWCPNCMDETKFLTQWYAKNKHTDVEILGLAYEANDDFNYASNRVKKMKEKFNISYNFVIAGTKDKAAASKTLPMLNGILAFPTIIFIGKDGKVKKIHTGFSGPGTGVYYDQYVQRFNETVKLLINRSPRSTVDSPR